MLSPFARIGAATVDSAEAVARLVMLLQDNIARALDRLLSNPRHDYVTVKGQALAGAADTTVNHKLGRQPQGWAITDQTGSDATVRRVSWSSTTIVLRASAAATVNLEVW